MPVSQFDPYGQVRQRVVRGGLVGDDVDGDAAAQQLGQHDGAVADEADRQRPRAALRRETASAARRRGRRPPRPGSACSTRRASRAGSTSITRQTPSFSVTASGWAPPIPPQPPVTVSVPGERAAEPLRRHRRERLVRALQDALGADVDPRPGRHLAVHGQSERLQAAELRPGRPVAAPGSSWRSAPAAPTRGCAARRPACRTGRAWSRRRAASVSVRTIASNASQLRAARPVPPYTTRSSGRSATSGSRLFISIRSGASVCQDRAVSVVPRGARTGRAPSMVWSFRIMPERTPRYSSGPVTVSAARTASP